MPEKIEYKGKDVDEAINIACRELEVSRDELKIEVVSPGSAGIFGLCRKKAIIHVSKKNNLTPSPRIRDVSPKQTEGQKRLKNGGAKSSTNKSPRRPSSPREKADTPPAKPPSPEIMDEVKGVLIDMLRLMGTPLDATLSAKSNRISAVLNGEDIDGIIGREGSTIDAIQYLMRKIISNRFHEKIFFSLDAGTYREDRKIELRELALEMSKQVKDTGKSRTISALNPAERRIIHVTLQDDDTIRSASIGDGLFKKIRVYLPGKGRKRPPRRNRSRNRRPAAAKE